jgi:predicted nucleotidyltransferase component of viral defense system
MYMDPKENKQGYASEMQRNVLVSLVNNSLIQDNFFLTGGTALSAFYLYHRLSNDLDLFTVRTIELPEIDFWIRQNFDKAAKIRQSETFLSFVIDEIKVDFVKDSLSIATERPQVVLENNVLVRLDTLDNIASNKLTTLVSRTETKDFIDFYFIAQKYPDLDREKILQDANKKDAIFDDMPTAAFQIEEGFGVVKNKSIAFPNLLEAIDEQRFIEFYKEMIAWLYAKGEKQIKGT